MSRAKAPGMGPGMVCPRRKVFIMYGSLKGVICAFLLAALLLSAAPVAAAPNQGFVGNQLWNWVFDWLTADRGPEPDPKVLVPGADAGPAVDPDGEDKGPNADPDGFVADGGPLIDPNG